MNKSFLKSKTMWGFGIAALIALGQVLGVPYTESTIAAIVQVLTAFFGAYGLRSAIE